MAVPAAGPLAVGAAVALAVGVAGQDEAPLGLAGVEAAEAGGGEGHEQPRMGGHRLGDELRTAGPLDRHSSQTGTCGRPSSARAASTNSWISSVLARV
jgi:hypothetical protein